MTFGGTQNRGYHFNAGPGTLPTPVLEQIQSELLNYRGMGASVMELSHRSPAFDEILEEAEQRMRELLEIPQNYAVLFLHGGASLHFAMAPMNLAQDNRPVQLVRTGYWSDKALTELKKAYQYEILASGEETGFYALPFLDPTWFSKQASYFHLTSNNTIYGTQWKSFPEVNEESPLVVDMSSDILSRRLAISQFGMIYAGAQKNIGPAGLGVVILRRDLAERASESLPTLFQYRTHIQKGSRFHTPPTFAIYAANLVLQWIQRQGGVEYLEEENERKAKRLYAFLDESSLYECPVQNPADRSNMNVVFHLRPEKRDKEAELLAEAQKQGLNGLQGHRAVGGLRASLYNAMPYEGVERLISFLHQFEKQKASG